VRREATFWPSRVSEGYRSGLPTIVDPEVSHHDLRHLFSTRVIESGVDIPTLSRWLGHKDGGALVCGLTATCVMNTRRRWRRRSNFERFISPATRLLFEIVAQLRFDPRATDCAKIFENCSKIERVHDRNGSLLNNRTSATLVLLTRFPAPLSVRLSAVDSSLERGGFGAAARARIAVVRGFRLIHC